MKSSLDIISVTKDDPDGVVATIASTKKLRNCAGVRQIVVDSSSAAVAEKIQALCDSEENVEYSWQEPSGISAAFNAGIKASRADWIWFLNGGDQVFQELDTNLLLGILGFTNAEVLIFQIELMQSRERLKHPPLWAVWPPIYWVPHPATFIKAVLFENYGVFDNDFRIAMDGDLWMRMFSRNIVVDMLSIPVVLYDQNGVSSNNTIGAEIEVKRIIKKNISLLLKMWMNRGRYIFRLFFYKH